jgi:hypothetical protein
VESDQKTCIGSYGYDWAISSRLNGQGGAFEDENIMATLKTHFTHVTDISPLSYSIYYTSIYTMVFVHMSTLTISSCEAVPLVAAAKAVPASADTVQLDTEQRRTEEYIRDDALLALEGMAQHPVVMVQGRGEFLWDIDGKRYIDFNTGYSAINQGHCHPRIVEAMQKQCAILTLPSRSVHTPQHSQFCKRIAELTGFDKVSLLNGGAEACDMAIKVARSWGYKCKGIPPDQAIVLMADHSYHGRTLGLLSASLDEDLRRSKFHLYA